MTIEEWHAPALRTFLSEGPDVWAERYAEQLRNENDYGYSILIHYALDAAMRRRFSPTYTVPEVIRYVADLRLALGEHAHEVDPRAAEGLIRHSLGDPSFSGRPPFGADQMTLTRTRLHLLIALVTDAELSDAELDALIEESAASARKWVAEQHSEPQR